MLECAVLCGRIALPLLLALAGAVLCMRSRCAMSVHGGTQPSYLADRQQHNSATDLLPGQDSVCSAWQWEGYGPCRTPSVVAGKFCPGPASTPLHAAII